MDEGQPLGNRRMDDRDANAMYLTADVLLGPMVGAGIALTRAPGAGDRPLQRIGGGHRSAAARERICPTPPAKTGGRGRDTWSAGVRRRGCRGERPLIPSRLIEEKRDGRELDPDDLELFLKAYLRDEVPQYQMAAFLMAVLFRGLSPAELEQMVHVMIHSGAVLELDHLPGPKVDKHSTGGVGDKVSLVLAPLAAELGLVVPMMAGRGLGHSGGTLDKLEAIPGFRTDLSLPEFGAILERVGCAMIGQTAEIAPLDKRLYALRDVTGTVPAIPLIAASIMSKKLAEGLDALVLDVKAGSGAFLPDLEDALALARTLVDIGVGHGTPTVALVTAMDRPLGRAIGNALEVREAVECLDGGGPSDLRAVVTALTAEMLVLAGAASDLKEAERRSREVLASGAALERFRSLVEAHGGDPRIIEDPGRLAFGAGAARGACHRSRSGRVGVPQTLWSSARRNGRGVAWRWGTPSTPPWALSWTCVRETPSRSAIGSGKSMPTPAPLRSWGPLRSGTPSRSDAESLRRRCH